MLRNKGFASLRWVVPVLALSLGLFKLGTGGAAQQITVPEVKNLTESFILTGESVKGGFVALTFRNNSDKSVTAYVLGFGPNHRRKKTEELMGGRPDSIPPGGTDTSLVSIETLGSGAVPGSSTPVVTVMAVVFSDSSSEGDFRTARGVLARRKGESVQLAAIRRLISAALVSSDVEKAVGGLRADIEALPETSPVGELPEFHAGLNFSKQVFMRKIDEVQYGDLDERILKKGNRNLSEADRSRAGLKIVLDDLDRQAYALAR